MRKVFNVVVGGKCLDAIARIRSEEKMNNISWLACRKIIKVPGDKAVAQHKIKRKINNDERQSSEN